MNEAMEKKRPRKLNFDAPLLSTRRTGAGSHISDKLFRTNSLVGWKDSSDGIPFCWEQAPGKPKNLEISNNIDDAETPRPKPPPSRWIPPKEANTGDQDQAFPDLFHNHDDGCDADVDDYDDDGNADVFSDAMEVLSLTEAMDIVEKAEKFHGSSEGLKSRSLEPSDLDGLNLESLGHSDCPSPNFIIERFLPDATALAAASALNLSKTKLPYLCNYSGQSPCASQAVIKRPFSSPKRCGLEMFLPWRMKHKLCGVKCPIKERASNIVQPETSKKQRKLFSSIVVPSGEWRCK
ncbi:hypothetical protein DITRI_Ditri12bG0186400 [Diplodiscus trichospermus]